MLIFADGATCACKSIATLPGGSLLLSIPEMTMVSAVAFLSNVDLSRFTFEISGHTKDYVGYTVLRGLSADDDGVRVTLGRVIE